MKINEDYRVKLKMWIIMRDSYASLIKQKFCYKKIPLLDLESGKEYDVPFGQYLLSLDHAIILMEREVRKMKQKSVWRKTIKSLLPW